MPRKKKQQQSEGACPRCRKLIPLVPADGGLLVLRTHHVVVAEPHYNGHAVEECPGREPADLDDSQDWAWVAKTEAPHTEPDDAMARLAGAARTVTEAVSAAAGATQESFTLTTEQVEAVAQVAVNSDAVRSAMTTSTVPPQIMTPSHVEPDGIDTVTGPIEINYVPDFLGTVLVAIRQAWIDETGAPPYDATVTLTTPDLMNDVQLLHVIFEPYGLRVSVPVPGEAANLPGAAEAAGREAAGVVRRALQERTATRCTATLGELPHECDQPVGEHEHLCRLCNWRWRDPVTPSITPDESL